MEFKARIRTLNITFLFQQMPSMAIISNISLHSTLFSISSSPDQSYEWHALLRNEVQGSSFLLSFMYESGVQSRDQHPALGPPF